MKFCKLKTLESTTIRKAYNDDKSVLFGLIGTVEDFLNVGLLDYCDYLPQTWCFLLPLGNRAFFAKDRDAIITLIIDWYSLDSAI